MYWDSTYFLVLLGALICGLASLNVRSTYGKYRSLSAGSGLTAQDAALRILHGAGIYDVRIQRVSGSLTDHYDPGEKVLRLSDGVYGHTSVAAIGIAAHECGHAIQHHTGYAPLTLRSAAVPVANIGSTLSWPLLLLGLILGISPLARLGVFLFTFVVLFQLITLPVEFNASRRAVAVLEGQQLLSGEALTGARRVLRAAALTYVAALLSSMLQLLRLAILAGGRRRD